MVDLAPITFLAVGKLGRPHGVKGELRMTVLTDFPERLKEGVRVFVGENHLPLHIRSCRPFRSSSTQDVLLIAFQDYDDYDKAAALRNAMVFVRADDRPPLPQGEYYHHQLIGLKVMTEQTPDAGWETLGTLTEILSTGANDVYVVRHESGREILIPAIEDTILDINLELGEMRVHLLPGLLEL
jgi:16S rRNA processing protein RimM